MRETGLTVIRYGVSDITTGDNTGVISPELCGVLQERQQTISFSAGRLLQEHHVTKASTDRLDSSRLYCSLNLIGFRYNKNTNNSL
ncbi:hypothetical protein J6590_045680 [Homalodisca vitripennis]|nr:hypothetical protein J6590_045678 [Homalodisca vitripennis]KAG8306512.1 hypothetical protein J6590_045680 [Homalodisca vitripennis]